MSARILEVLYEDEDCLVVNKPAGIAVHPSAPGQGGTQFDSVSEYYRQTGNSYPPRHIHRLDDFTSGPVLYAKNLSSQKYLDEQMRNKAIDRVYIAFVTGEMKKIRGILNFPIGRDRHHNQRRRVSLSGQSAVTHYEVIEVYKGVSQVRLWLETGRTHQIRVHLSHIGHPLLGDKLYGGAAEWIARQALHGEMLRFKRPANGESMAVTAPWPEDMAFLPENLTY